MRMFVVSIRIFRWDSVRSERVPTRILTRGGKLAVCGEFVLEAMPVENGCHVIFGRGRLGVVLVFINRSRIGGHVTALSQHAEKRLIYTDEQLANVNVTPSLIIPQLSYLYYRWCN